MYFSLIDRITEVDDGKSLSAIKDVLSTGSDRLSELAAPPTPAAPQPAPLPPKIQVVNKIPKAFLDIIRTQFYILQTWIEPLMRLAEATDIGGKDFRKAVKKSNAQYQELLEALLRVERKHGLSVGGRLQMQ